MRCDVKMFVPVTVVSHAEIETLLSIYWVGNTIANIDVYGINNLKTLEPTLGVATERDNLSSCLP